MTGPDEDPDVTQTARRRKRPQEARVSPQALAAARGGVRGRPRLARPGARIQGLAAVSGLRLLGRALLFGAFRFQVATSGQEHLPPGGYLLVGAVHRGWMDPFLIQHALPWSRASGSSAVARPRSRAAGGRCSSTGSAGCSPSGGAASASTSTSRPPGRSCATAASSS